LRKISEENKEKIEDLINKIDSLENQLIEIKEFQFKPKKVEKFKSVLIVIDNIYQKTKFAIEKLPI